MLLFGRNQSYLASTIKIQPAFQAIIGMNNHFRSAIRLEFVDDFNYEITELDIIQALSLQKKSSYKILDKKLTRHNGKMYDIIKVSFTNPSQGKNVVRIDTL